MRINKDVIAKLSPCTDRFNNFKKEYPDFDGQVTDFLNLDKITYNDKVWVMTRLMTKNQLVHWSILCAESVKHIFESKYPQNKSLSNLFNYLKSGLDFENLSQEEKNKISELRRAAYYATYAAYYAASVASAAAAAYYAASAADAAYYAASAASAASAADAAREEQNNLNLLYLASLINESEEV